MAQLNTESNTITRKRRARRKSTHIDFTPMVDLAFLLITFFMLTTSLRTFYKLDINQPFEGPPSAVQDSIVMTVLLTGQNKIFYYFGFLESGIRETNFSPKGLREILLKKNAPQIIKVNQLRLLYESNQLSEEEFKNEVGKVITDQRSLMVLIKSDENSKYKNLIDLVDELYITNVGRYSVMDLTEEERDFLENAK